MNKNTKNKLTIKSNWNKSLTISDKDLNILKGGTGGGGNCSCEKNPGDTDSVQVDSIPSVDCPCR